MAALASVVLVGAACSNSSSGTTPAGAGAPGITPTEIDVGSLATETGSFSAGFGEIVDGVKAYFAMINAQGGVDGRKLVLKYELDDTGNPTTDTAQARTLVEQDHVFAIVGVGTPLFAGAQYLAQSGTPTFGYVVSQDWQNAPNLFGAYGSTLDYTTGASTTAFIANQLHATAVGVVAYGVAPQSKDACQADANGMKALGINVPFVDVNYNYFNGNPDPDVLQMKADHVDLMLSCMQGKDNLAFANSFVQHGMNGVKEVWLNGYDRSQVAANPPLQNNQIYLLQHVPFEAAAAFPGKYPGMELYLKTMQKYEPQWVYDDIAIQGWINAAQFVQGLRDVAKEGKPLTQANLIAAINKETAFTAGGLMAPLNWTVAHTQAVPPFCSGFVQTVGGRFVPAFVQPGDQVLVCFTKQSATPVTPPPGTPGT